MHNFKCADKDIRNRNMCGLSGVKCACGFACPSQIGTNANVTRGQSPPPTVSLPVTRRPLIRHQPRFPLTETMLTLARRRRRTAKKKKKKSPPVHNSHTNTHKHTSLTQTNAHTQREIASVPATAGLTLMSQGAKSLGAGLRWLI